jgi:hypothetical protein
MREKKNNNPKPKELSLTEARRKAKEIKQTVEKREIEKVNKIYKEVVVKPKQRIAVPPPPPPAAAPPSFRDIIDVKTFYKSKYKAKYQPKQPILAPEDSTHDRRELLRQAMDSFTFF